MIREHFEIPKGFTTIGELRPQKETKVPVSFDFSLSHGGREIKSEQRLVWPKEKLKFKFDTPLGDCEIEIYVHNVWLGRHKREDEKIFNFGEMALFEIKIDWAGRKETVKFFAPLTWKDEAGRRRASGLGAGIEVKGYNLYINVDIPECYG